MITAGMIADYLFAGVLLLSPLFYLSGESIELSAQKFIIFALSMVLVGVGIKKKERNFDFKTQWIFPLVLCLNVMFNNFNIKIISYAGLALVAFLIMRLVYEYVGDVSKLKNALCISAGLNALVLVMQKIGINPMAGEVIGKEGGLMGNAPVLCMFLALCVPFLYEKSVFLLIPVAIIALISKESTFFVVMTILLLSIILNKRIKRALIPVVCLFPIIALIASGHVQNSLFMRLGLWGHAIEATMQRPLLGWGVGILPEIADQMRWVPFYHVNVIFNSYLTILFSLGIPSGAVVLIVLMRKFFKSFRQNPENYAVFSMMIYGLFEYPLEAMRLWVPMAFVFAMYLIKRRDALCG